MLQRDRGEAALAVLQRIHADAKDPEGYFAKREFHAMLEQFALDSDNCNGSYKELLTQEHNLKRVALGFLALFGAQCTGTLVINSMFGFCATPSNVLKIQAHDGKLTLLFSSRLRYDPLLQYWIQRTHQHRPDSRMGHCLYRWKYDYVALC